MIRFALLAACAILSGCTTTQHASTYDVIVRNGTIYDGSGGAPFTGDVAIQGDKIVQVGRVSGTAAAEIDAPVARTETAPAR